MARDEPDYGNGRGNEGGRAAIQAAQTQAAPERDLFAAAADGPTGIRPPTSKTAARKMQADGSDPGGKRYGRDADKPLPGADSSLAEAIAPQLSLDTGDVQVRKAAPGLADKFLVPPFTVLDSRQAYWQERRRAWLSLGMRGEATAIAGRALGTTEGEHRMSGKDARMGSTAPSAQRETYEQLGATGRKGGMIYDETAPASDPGFYTKKRKVEQTLGREISTEEFKRDHYRREDQDFGQSASVATGTSVFDPVLCEIAYRWFSFAGATVLDPFAGGAVRGVLAGILGRAYHGVELRPEQIADNREQAQRLLTGEGAAHFGREPVMPTWYEGDATKMYEQDLPYADLVFTCPPYADLEVYSDNPADLSTMPYPKFREGLAAAMEGSAAMLRPDRFAVWVVGEARDKKTGHEYGFVPDTIMAARAAGLGLYNSAILVNSVGSAALRAQRIVRTRKLTRVHQHVLTFVKGDAKKAALACGNAELEV